MVLVKALQYTFNSVQHNRFLKCNSFKSIKRGKGKNLVFNFVHWVFTSIVKEQLFSAKNFWKIFYFFVFVEFRNLVQKIFVFLCYLIIFQLIEFEFVYDEVEQGWVLREVVFVFVVFFWVNDIIIIVYVADQFAKVFFIQLSSVVEENLTTNDWRQRENFFKNFSVKRIELSIKKKNI